MFRNNRERAIRAYQLYKGTFTIVACRFEGNVDWRAKKKEGGAVYVKEAPFANVTIADSAFVNNTILGRDEDEDDY